jgi:tetratricopeptide (TPR) repeat protein
MKNKPLKNKSSTLPLFLLIGIFIFTIPSIASPQSIESARDKYESGDFEGALEEVQAILEQDSKNLRAQSLMSEIERAMKKVEAQELTERALVEINSRRFEEAYGYLEQALILDPENSQARELYLSIHEVLQVEGESMEEMLKRQQEELAVLEEEPVGEVPAEVEPIEVEPEEEEEPEPEPVEEKAPLVRRYDRVSIRGGFVFTFANSNNLNYVDSSVTLLGIRLDGRYYFNFWERRLGLSLDYTGDFLKLGGSEYINFGTHRLNFSVRIRTYFFDRDYGRLTLGARLNYHLFLLNNREDQGVYNFTSLYGPSLGIFFEDPVIYRFWKVSFLRSFGFEGEFNYLFIIGQGADAPSASEWYLGAYYDLKCYRFHTGYRRYRIRNDDVKEAYNDIELGAGYRF